MLSPSDNQSTAVEVLNYKMISQRVESHKVDHIGISYLGPIYTNYPICTAITVIVEGYIHRTLARW